MLHALKSGRFLKKGQSVLEYAILLSVLGLVFATMFVYMRNSVRSKIYVVQKRLNEAGTTKAFPVPTVDPPPIDYSDPIFSPEEPAPTEDGNPVNPPLEDPHDLPAD